MLRLLAIATLLAAAPTAAHCQRSLPALPDSVPSALGYVPVVKVAHLKCPSPIGPVDAYGCFAPMSRVISVRDSIPLLLMWLALEHERKHLEFWDAGLRFADRELEDMIARVLSVARVNEMLHAPGSP